MKGSALEKFAQEARIQLKEQVKARLNLIINGDDSVDLIENRNAIIELKKALNEKGEESLVEEVAYTWFNRFSALRYMDARGFNSTMIVSPTEGKLLPEILSDALAGVFDDALSNKQKDKIQGLVDGSITSKNLQADIYRILLVASCNALNDSLPLLFEKINDYTDLLLPDDLLSSESIITKTVDALSIEDCEDSVEIIGWLYQYYISEKKDEVFASFKKGKKAGKDEIPAATQLFTPEWIVRYLVENSLGRLWMLNHPDSKLKDKMKYYIPPTDAEKDFIKLSSPEEIKILDPCCGSGHMLTYGFDLLFEIYNECGYTDNDATESIIKNNLFGIEIDKRAGQLAYFALMMKARERSKRFFRKHIGPNICILENVSFEQDELAKVYNLFDKPTLNLMDLMNQFEHADILGSLITPAVSDIKALKDTLKVKSSDDIFAETNTLTERTKKVLEMAGYLSEKYHVVVTNPPYMGNSHMDALLKAYLEKEYKPYKSDLFSAFFIRCCNCCDPRGHLGFMSPYVWMFISSYEDLRREFIENKTITTLAQLEYSAFSEATVPLCIFTLYNQNTPLKGIYFRLTEFTGGMEVQDKKILEAISNHDCGYYYEASPEQFEKIPGSPIAYWASNRIFALFANTAPIVSCCQPLVGLQTADNGRFLRLWHEISTEKICYDANSLQEALQSNKKWFPYNKGGDYRKWYGNNEYLVNWENDGYEIKHFVDNKGKLRSRPQNTIAYFKPSITWSDITSANFACRICNGGFIFDVKGSSAIGNKDDLLIQGAILNSKVAGLLIDMINPTMTTQVGDLKRIPMLFPEGNNIVLVRKIVLENYQLSKANWDSFETSWDFGRHPLLYVPRSDSMADGTVEDLIQDTKIAMQNGFSVKLADMYEEYKDDVNTSFVALKHNEEELNRIFIDIYGLQDELTPEEDDSMVSVHRIFDSKSEIPESMKKGQYALTKEDVIKSLVSYAVGCMFGRYNPFKNDLAYAGGEWDESVFDKSFMPDDDNVIPMMDDSWFENDAERYFIKFLEVMYGKETLNENLKFVENALGMSVRKYLAKYFYIDHLKTYQKRPIYWMFSSPKGHFQALVYMHRYNENTANVVLKYLREFRAKIQSQIKMAEEAGETKKALDFQNIDKDLNDYEMNVLYPLAVQHITFDLDDGVKVNYQKLGKALKTIK